MLRPKSCPRCKTGDVGVDKDHHGWYEFCIQCGYLRDLIGVIEVETKPSGQAKGRGRGSRTSGKGKSKYA
ncbi:MAG: hypothetical protein HQ588_06265 [Deltaproteobacteria bacterium]|nr:hypothetical protein [Deltaproteobacteria bacterium]